MALFRSSQEKSQGNLNRRSHQAKSKRKNIVIVQSIAVSQKQVLFSILRKIYSSSVLFVVCFPTREEKEETHSRESNVTLVFLQNSRTRKQKNYLVCTSAKCKILNTF